MVRMPAAFQAVFNRQIEIWRVHADEHVRALGQQFGLESRRMARMARRLRSTSHSRARHSFSLRKQAFQPGGLHFGAADADKARIRAAGADGVDQPRAQHIARGFACHHGDAQAGVGWKQAHQRMMLETWRGQKVHKQLPVPGSSAAASVMAALASPGSGLAVNLQW